MPDHLNQQEKTKVNHQDDSAAPTRSVQAQAFVMALGTLTSRVLGLAREVLFAALFPRMVTDAWYAAFRLPNVFRRLFGEGSLAVSFIPVFVEAQHQGPDRARNLVNAFYTLFLILMAGLTAIGTIWAEPILRLLLDPRFLADPERLALVLRMSQIMFGYVFLVCTYAYFMAILNALGKFGWPALAPAFFNVAMVISTLLPQELFAWSGQALSWGVILGGLVQVGVLIPSLWRQGYLPKPVSVARALQSPEVRRIFAGMAPGLVGMSLLQVMTLVNMNFASSLGQGPISYLNLADRLMEIPLSLVSVSLGTALLPRLSRLWSENQVGAMIETAFHSFRLNLFICLPAAIGLFFLAHPIVELLFQHGHFLPEESEIVAEIIRVYAFVMVMMSSVRVFVPAFYAVKNTKAPAVAALVSLLVHIFLAPVLMKTWGLVGLNVSSFVSVSVNLFLLFFFFQRRIGSLPWRELMQSLWRWWPPLLALAFWLQSDGLLRERVGSGFVARGSLLAFEIVVGMILFAVLNHWLRVPEYLAATQGIRRRLEEKFKS